MVGKATSLRLFSLLIYASLLLAVFAGASSAVNGCASIGYPDCTVSGKVCCATKGDLSYDQCVPASDLCVTPHCGTFVSGSGSCNTQGAIPSSFDECAAIDHASCCRKADGCVWSDTGCSLAVGRLSATILCSSLDNTKAGCEIFSDGNGVGACTWNPPACAQSTQQCLSSSPDNLDCCLGAGACTQVGNGWKCICPGVGGDCSSVDCCSGLTCSSSNKCCYSTGGACTQAGSQCCPGSTCDSGTLKCKTCGGQSCISASDCCTGYACKLKGASKKCCIDDNSATACNYGSDCCSGICTGHVCQPNACAVAPTIPSYTDVTLDSYQGLINTFTYNMSEKNYKKTGLPNALLFMVNLTAQSNVKICYKVADSTGHMQMPYDQAAPGCTDYWFIFCPRGDAALATDAGRVSREICLNSTKIKYDTLIYPQPTPCTPSPPAPKSYLDHILSHNELFFCNKVTKDYAPLCWPLMLILGLLLGASFAAGKNPFHAFDFSSPRMNRGRQYSARVQNKSFDFLSYIMGAATTASSANSMAKALKSPGGFGAFMKNELKSVINPVGNIKNTIAGLKSSMGALGKADASLTKADANLKKELQKIPPDTKAISKAQNAYDTARAKYVDAKAAFADSAAAKTEKGKEILSAANSKLAALDARHVDMKKVITNVTGSDRFSPAKTLFQNPFGSSQPTQQTALSPTNAQQVNMSVSIKGTALGSRRFRYMPQKDISIKDMIKGSRGTIIKGMKQAHREDRKLLIKETKDAVKYLKHEKEKARAEVKSGQAGAKEKLLEVKKDLKVARLERSQARSWKVGDEKPKSVEDLTKEAKDKIAAAEKSKDLAALGMAKDQLASLESIGKTRAQFRLERQNLVKERQGKLDALVSSNASKKDIKQAKIDLYQAKSWIYGDTAPKSIGEKLTAATQKQTDAKKKLDAIDKNDVAGVKAATQELRTATQEISYLTHLGMSGKELRVERRAEVSKLKNLVPDAGKPQATSQPSKEERADLGQKISDARDIGRMPSTGTSGAQASAFGARDTIGTLISLFRKGTWTHEAAKDRMAASGVDEYFKYAANASSTGQAFTMLLEFILKKMMENAKLRNRETQQGQRVQTSISFRSVNSAISSLFRIYSVMSVLSAYTKGLGVATGSRSLKGGIGFMDSINSASFGSAGKYNLNAATLASWVDRDLAQQMVGPGLPFPFDKLQFAVGGAVNGGGLLVQKFSDIFKREAVTVMVTKDRKIGYQIGEAGKDVNGRMRYQVVNCFDMATGKALGKKYEVTEENGKRVIMLEGGKALEIDELSRNYLVKGKDDLYVAMSVAAARRYDKLQADRSELYKNSNEFISQRYWFAQRRTYNYEILKKVESGQGLTKEEEQKHFDKKLRKLYYNYPAYAALSYMDEMLNKKKSGQTMTPDEQVQLDKARKTLHDNYPAYAALSDKMEKGQKLTADEQKQYDEVSKSSRIGAILRGGDKYVARQSKASAYALMAKLPDVSSMPGEEQMQVLGLRSALEKHIDFANSTIDIIRCTEASQAVLKIIQAGQTRDVLAKQLEDDNATLKKFEAEQGKRKMTDGERAFIFDVGQSVKNDDMALHLYDAIAASGLDLKKDVLDYAGQITKANNAIADNMMKSLHFSDSYIQCYTASIVLGMENRMPDIASFSGIGIAPRIVLWSEISKSPAKDRSVLETKLTKNGLSCTHEELERIALLKDGERASFKSNGRNYYAEADTEFNRINVYETDALENRSDVLGNMSRAMSASASVRFKDKQAADNYRKSLAGLMDAGAEYSATMSQKSQKEFANSLESANTALLAGLKFDGRFAGTEFEIMQKLDDAKKQRASHTDELGNYIGYLTEMNSAIVALHQTSDSYLNAQMAKTGWQDRAPYMNSPESDMLISMIKPSQVSGTQRPSLELGIAPAWFSLGSYSKMKYMADSKFEVKPMRWKGATSPSEPPVQQAPQTPEEKPGDTGSAAAGEGPVKEQSFLSTKRKKGEKG
ncbi:MAG: hypothetical protein NTX79_02030 [Candidatus Micrarchaeota archaeon]|nr:hypothetical protein [Candidatus Micrarchaeota archaeon]